MAVEPGVEQHEVTHFNIAFRAQRHDVTVALLLSFGDGQWPKEIRCRLVGVGVVLQVAVELL